MVQSWSILLGRGSTQSSSRLSGLTLLLVRVKTYSSIDAFVLHVLTLVREDFERGRLLGHLRGSPQPILTRITFEFGSFNASPIAFQ